MMTHILSNLTKSYKNIIENIEDKLDDDGNPLTTKMIHDKISAKYDQMNVQSEIKKCKGR